MLGRVAKSAGNLSTGLKARKIPLLSGKESQKESDAHFYRVCNQRNLDLPPRLLISTEANLAERKHRNVPKRFPPTVIIIIPTVKSSKKKKERKIYTRIKFRIALTSFSESLVQNLRISDILRTQLTSQTVTNQKQESPLITCSPEMKNKTTRYRIVLKRISISIRCTESSDLIGEKSRSGRDPR